MKLWSKVISLGVLSLYLITQLGLYSMASVNWQDYVSSVDTQLAGLPRPVQVITSGRDTFRCYATVIDGNKKVHNLSGNNLCDLTKGDILSEGGLNIEKVFNLSTCNERCNRRCTDSCKSDCRRDGQIFGIQ